MYRKIKINYSRLLIKNFVSKKMMEYISNVLKLKKKKLSTQNYIYIENTFFK